MPTHPLLTQHISCRKQMFQVESPMVHLYVFRSTSVRTFVRLTKKVPKTKLNIGKRAFSVAAPTIWKQLLIMIKSSEIIDTFR